MENSFIAIETEKSPEIIGDIEKGTLSIVGKSLPEDARSFFSPFQNWLGEFYKSKADILQVSIELEYYNTVSSKVLVNMMREMKTLQLSRKIQIEWRYDQDDIEMEETGNDFRKLVGDILVMTPIELKS